MAYAKQWGRRDTSEAGVPGQADLSWSLTSMS